MYVMKTESQGLGSGKITSNKFALVLYEAECFFFQFTYQISHNVLDTCLLTHSTYLESSISGDEAHESLDD